MAGTLTQTQLVAEVLDNLTKRTTATTISGSTLSTMAIRWLNRAQLRVARRYNLLFRIATATTVASQQSYSFPGSLRSVFSVRLEDGNDSVKLGICMPWEFDAVVPKPSTQTTGRPDLYIPYKTTNTFELFRIPNAAYTMRIRHSFWPTDFSSASQTSDYTYMDDVLIAFATMYGWQWLQEYKDRDAWLKFGEEELAGAIKAEKDSYPDWAPVAKGYGPTSPPLGEYYNNPFVITDPNG